MDTKLRTTSARVMTLSLTDKLGSLPTSCGGWQHFQNHNSSVFERLIVAVKWCISREHPEYSGQAHEWHQCPQS